MLKTPFNGTEIITNAFRPNGDPRGVHLGTDYAMNFRTAIIAVTESKVIKASYSLPIGKPQDERQWVANTKSDPYKKTILGKIIPRALTTADYGNFVKLDHGSGISTLYAHLDELLVKEGEIVKEGQLIGYSDSTGNSTGNHIHFEIRINDIVVDPSKFDYTFNGTGGVSPEELNPMDGLVTITCDILYVRSEPKTTARLAGSRELHLGQEVEVSDWVHGEMYQGTDIWYKSKYNNYFWSGGTNKKGLPDNTEGKKKVNRQELEQKKADLEVQLSAITAEINSLVETEVVSTVAETPVVTEVAPEVPTEVVAEPSVEEVKETVLSASDKTMILDQVTRIDSFLSEVKKRLGL